jgi:hypothetical protein
MESRAAVRQHRAAAGGVGMLLSGETDFAMAGFSPHLIRQGRTTPENPTAVERAAALGESATKRSADPAAAPAGFGSGPVIRFHGQQVRRISTLEVLEEHEFDASRAALLYLRLQALVPVATWRTESPDKRRVKEADCRITVGNLGGMRDGHLSGMRGCTRCR